MLKYIKSQKIRFFIFGTLTVVYTLVDMFSDIFVLSLVSSLSFVYYFIFFELGYYIAENKINKSGQSICCLLVI